MKVLHVIDSMDPRLGGVCQAVRTLYAGLSAKGLDNEIVSLDASGAEYGLPNNMVVHFLGPAKTPWHYSRQLRPWLIRHMNRFDVVMVHGLWLYVSHAACRAVVQENRRRKQEGGNKPVQLFVMPHGMLDPYFQKAPDRKLKAIRNIFYFGLIEKRVVNRCHSLFFTCQEEERLAATTFRGYAPKHTTVVGMAIEEPPPYDAFMTQAFSQACATRPESPYLLYLSRIHEKKGLDLLVEAYERLLGEGRQGPTTIPDLVIAGPGWESGFGQSLRRKFAGSELLRDRVHCVGMLQGAAKWGALYGCCAFVLASHQENFGIAVVEALGCGKPVLISDKVNIWKEIIAGGGGMAAPDTVAGAYELLQRWVNIPAGAGGEMARNARSVYSGLFTIPAFTDKLIAAMTTREVNPPGVAGTRM